MQRLVSRLRWIQPPSELKGGHQCGVLPSLVWITGVDRDFCDRIISDRHLFFNVLRLSVGISHHYYDFVSTSGQMRQNKLSARIQISEFRELGVLPQNRRSARAVHERTTVKLDHAVDSA